MDEIGKDLVFQILQTLESLSSLDGISPNQYRKSLFSEMQELEIILKLIFDRDLIILS